MEGRIRWEIFNVFFKRISLWIQKHWDRHISRSESLEDSTFEVMK